MAARNNVYAEPVGRVTRSMSANDNAIKSKTCSEFDEETGKTFKVTEDANIAPIVDAGLQVSGTYDVEVGKTYDVKSSNS